jgi:penicillin-binding protein 1C
VGNADGTGRPGLTGVQTAAPILFDLFKLLDHRQHFLTPSISLVNVETCAQSGMRKGPHCTESHWQWAPEAGQRTDLCTYHRLLFLDPTTGLQVNSNCFPPHQMESRPYFEVPAAHAYYYKTKHPDYIAAPAFHPQCAQSGQLLDILYPRSGSTLFLPKGLKGEVIPIVLQATHKAADQKLYWDLDGTYIGQTQTIHQLEIIPQKGYHVLTVTDESGNRTSVSFATVASSTP